MGSATPPPPGFTPLLFAARAGHPEVIRVLAKAGANVNDTAVNGTPALVMAVQNAHYDAAVALLQAFQDLELALPDAQADMETLEAESEDEDAGDV